MKLLGNPDIPDTFQPFIKVVPFFSLFQTLIIHGKAFDDVLFQDIGSPDAELGGPFGIYTVTDGRLTRLRFTAQRSRDVGLKS